MRDAGNRMARDGLNSLKYSVENVIEHRLYTLVKADVKKALG